MLKSRLSLLKSSNLLRIQSLQQHRPCTTNTEVSEDEKERELERIAKDASLDEPPTACCRTGCANCVFIVWAEAIAGKMQNAGPEITDKIMKMVDDPSMKAYLEMELRIRGLKKD